jgi:hypothetical protein
MDADLHAHHGSQLTRAAIYKPGWPAEKLIAYLRAKPLPELLDLFSEVVPEGWVISSPEREQAIDRMETLVEISARRPTQYGRFANRPY